MAGSCLTRALAALGQSFFSPLGLSFHISNSDTGLQSEIQVPGKLETSAWVAVGGGGRGPAGTAPLPPHPSFLCGQRCHTTHKSKYFFSGG